MNNVLLGINLTAYQIEGNLQKGKLQLCVIKQKEDVKNYSFLFL